MQKRHSISLFVALSLGACSAKVQVIGVSGSDASVGPANPDAFAVDRAAPFDFGFFVPDVIPADAPIATAVDLDCATAAKQRANAGCSFYAVEVPTGELKQSCFAMFVVNPGTQPAALKLERSGTSFSLAQVARLPRGSGTKLTYASYDAMAGLAPGDVAILFLAGVPGASNDPDSDKYFCPSGTQPALTKSTVIGHTTVKDEFGTNMARYVSGLGQGFHLTSDRPLIAYQMNPYGGARSALTSATLLLPEEAWGGNYLAVTPMHQGSEVGDEFPPFLMVVAGADGTEVALKPRQSTAAGTGIAATRAGQVLKFRLDAGQFAQVAAAALDKDAIEAGLSGTVVAATKPIAIIGGANYLYVDQPAADGVHQQIPPFSAWGREYAAVPYPNRWASRDEVVPWQIVAVVDNTVLSYDPAPPAVPQGAEGDRKIPPPTTLSAGQSVTFWSKDSFLVRSQDADHPIFVTGYMTGACSVAPAPCDDRTASPGDADFVNVVATDQYMTRYTFFTDPTYPETHLVVVRKRGADGQFADVKLDCARSPVTGWAPLGSNFQFARVPLVSGNYQPATAGCDNGVQKMASSAPFAVTVWGWGSNLVNNTGFVSYAYPAGAALGQVNTVKPPPIIE